MAEFLSTQRMRLGIIDGTLDTEVPSGAVLKSDGFDYREGYAKAAKGRSKSTNQPWTDTQVVRPLRWKRADGTERFYVLVAGGLFEATSFDSASWTLRSVLDVGATTATRSSLTVTISGAKCLLSVQAGDYFYYDADGISAGGIVDTVDSDTQLTLTGYTGAGTSGNFTLWRKLDADFGQMIVAGNRLFVFDKDNIPHWYGDRGDGTWAFRPIGLPQPAKGLTITLASGGALTAGNYSWKWAYLDRAGDLVPQTTGLNFGAPQRSQSLVATANDKATISGFVNGPEWAHKIGIWRTKAGGGQWFCVYKDILNARLASAVGSGPTTLTLATDSSLLVAGMHVDRYVTFAATGNSYLISANTTTTITTATDASGESGTDTISITGGFDLDQLVAGSFVDLVSDANLDLNHQAPDENDQPPSGLIHPHLIDGGGRLAAYQDTTKTKMWVSGRNSYAKIPTGSSRGGIGEWDFWANYVHVGNQTEDEVKATLVLGQRAFALKENSIWELYKEPLDVGRWFYRKSDQADSVGILAYDSIGTREGVAYWWGHEGGEVDVIRFDGNIAYGLGRQYNPNMASAPLRVILDTVSSHSTVTGTIYKGKYLMSYVPTGISNKYTLALDLKTHAWSHHPWGCGAFAQDYFSGDTNIKYCAAPTSSDGYMYKLDGENGDSGSNITRTIVSPAFSYGPNTRTKWTWVQFAIVNGTTPLDTAPTVTFSTDGLPFDNGSKTWQAIGTAQTWQSTVGEFLYRAVIPAGEWSRDIHIKITSADQKIWGIKEIRVAGEPTVQDNPLE